MLPSSLTHIYKPVTGEEHELWQNLPADVPFGALAPVNPALFVTPTVSISTRENHHIRHLNPQTTKTRETDDDRDRSTKPIKYLLRTLSQHTGRQACAFSLFVFFFFFF